MISVGLECDLNSLRTCLMILLWLGKIGQEAFVCHPLVKIAYLSKHLKSEMIHLL